MNHKCSANLLELILTLITILQLQLLLRSHHYQALAKPRGLIYNRDGKFIFKPPKSDQGHIIVIEDRYRNNIRDKERDTSASEQLPDTHSTQLMGPRFMTNGQRPTGPYPPPGAAIQLINIDPRQMVQPGPQHQHPPAFLHHPSSLMQAQAASLRVIPGSFQMVPVVQVLHPAPLTKPPLSYGDQGGQAIDYELNAEQQVAQSYGLPSQQHYNQAQSYGPPTRASYRPMVGIDQHYGYDTNEFQPDSSNMNLFDEQMSRPEPPPPPKQMDTQSYRQHPSQRRRSSSPMSPVHDLYRLEDTDTAQMDLNDDFGRSRGMGPLPGQVGPSNYELMKQLEPIGVAPPTQEPPISRTKKQVKKNATGRSKPFLSEVLRLKAPSGGSDTLERSQANQFDENVTPGDVHIISQSKDPKSSQYWKQFKDQFDIMTR